MPELPDVAVYCEALRDRVVGHRLERVLIRGPFLLRSVSPPVEDAIGQRVGEVRRVGKRIALGFENGVWLVLHLMIAGRLHWGKPRKDALATFEFDSGVLTLTEAGKQHRASLHMSIDPQEFDAGGLDVMAASAMDFAARLRSANHTLKRALADPHLFSGIGNAYSDEILHRAKLSPVALTLKLSDEQALGLYEACRAVLSEWVEHLRSDAGGKFPEKVTAFREGMSVHGRYGLPCPACGTKVQRIRYASNETNYCPECQTGGKLLADRGLSRLLREDWPRSLDELEERKKVRT